MLQKSHSLSISQALRRVLDNSQLRSLADILRLEIACEGWLSFYDDEDPIDVQQNVRDDHISLITHMLSSILDALGPAGWMRGSSSKEEFNDSVDTISWMKAEISAALEGIEEATYLQHVLGEVLLCGKDTGLSRDSSKAKYAWNSGMRKGAIRPSNAAFKNPASGELPLGLKLRPQISLNKVGAGGEIIKRSKRDLGRLKSQLVGKYTFEQIRV